MLYHILYPLSDLYPIFNVFRYITTRSFFAFVIAALVSILWGQKFIQWMQAKQYGQSVRDDGPQTHLKKAGTPTMGGIYIVGSVVFAVLLCGNFSSAPLCVTLFVLLSYFVLGLVDDYLKILKKDPKGVSAKGKLFWQFLVGIVAGLFLWKVGELSPALYTPFYKYPVTTTPWAFLLLSTLVIVGSSNAVNLTDGLDGLAIGPIITSAATLGILAYLSGHFDLAQYLLIPFVEGSGELVVLAAALVGAGVGFLWYNTYPAQIFMGDVGSLSIGGALGAMAICTKNELLFVLFGGIFVLEALSVILQVGSFKIRKKRIFKMAPIHHHFELKGWAEPKVIVRFWIVSVVMAILSLATLKLR